MSVWRQTGAVQALGVALAALVTLVAGWVNAAPGAVMAALAGAPLLLLGHHVLGKMTSRDTLVPGLFLFCIAAILGWAAWSLATVPTSALWFGAASVAVWLLAW